MVGLGQDYNNIFSLSCKLPGLLDVLATIGTANSLLRFVQLGTYVQLSKSLFYTEFHRSSHYKEMSGLNGKLMQEFIFLCTFSILRV